MEEKKENSDVTKEEAESGVGPKAASDAIKPAPQKEKDKKILEKYNLNAHGMAISVTIESSAEEFVP
ncbi:hypothetical protein M1583_02965, partial [Candidatus Marsarchaeota archaeon]|nr:hypothetical protein [Candidatus Marsarchaeota archaeon]